MYVIDRLNKFGSERTSQTRIQTCRQNSRSRYVPNICVVYVDWIKTAGSHTWAGLGHTCGYCKRGVRWASRKTEDVR